jgi:hypothetical protein
MQKATAAQIKRALAYFDRKGIDPRVEPAPGTFPPALPQAPRFAAAIATGITTQACIIELVAALFYAHLTVGVPAIGKTFEGHSGGVGLGDITAGGVIYYDDLSALLGIHDFGVFFGAEMGGVMHVTWGAYGNATAAGVGEGLGAFGGNGDWS